MVDDRKSVTVWLKPRHKQMMAEMPDINIGEIARRAIEELFEGRNDREYAQLCLEEDLAEVMSRWERFLGLKSSLTVTATEDGFRVVLVSTKDYRVDKLATVEEPALIEERGSEIEEEFNSWDDEWGDEPE